jgi:hypothetical protein
MNISVKFGDNLLKIATCSEWLQFLTSAGELLRGLQTENFDGLL